MSGRCPTALCRTRGGGARSIKSMSFLRPDPAVAAAAAAAEFGGKFQGPAASASQQLRDLFVEAAYRGPPSVVLDACAADPDWARVRNHMLGTPLMKALRRGHVALVEALYPLSDVMGQAVCRLVSGAGSLYNIIFPRSTTWHTATGVCLSSKRSRVSLANSGSGCCGAYLKTPP